MPKSSATAKRAEAELLSVTQVAEQVGVSRRWVLKLIDSQKLAAVRIGKSWFVDRTAAARVSVAGRGKRETAQSP